MMPAQLTTQHIEQHAYPNGTGVANKYLLHANPRLANLFSKADLGADVAAALGGGGGLATPAVLRPAQQDWAHHKDFICTSSK